MTRWFEHASEVIDHLIWLKIVDAPQPFFLSFRMRKIQTFEFNWAKEGTFNKEPTKKIGQQNRIFFQIQRKTTLTTTTKIQRKWHNNCYFGWILRTKCFSLSIPHNMNQRYELLLFFFSYCFFLFSGQAFFMIFTIFDCYVPKKQYCFRKKNWKKNKKAKKKKE